MTMCFLLRTMLKMLNIKGLIIWNYYKVDGAQSKQGGAKYTPCISGFCDTSLTECSPSQAFSHILGKAVQPIMDRANKYGGTLNSDGWSCAKTSYNKLHACY